MRAKTSILGAAVSLALCVGSADPCWAQEAGASDSGGTQLAEVIVTARRRSENEQQVPIAITTLGTNLLVPGVVDSAQDIQFHVPGLQVNPDTIHMDAVPTFSLRGLTTTNPSSTVADASVATYFGGAPVISNFQISHEFYDLQNIQTLRGPQGTLFGKNSTGGAVLIEPQKPTRDFAASATATVGNYGLIDTIGAVNVPINDTLQLRAAVDIARRGEGYTQNLIGSDYDTEHFNAGRVTLRFSPSDAFNNTTMFDGFTAHENAVAQLTQALGGTALFLYGAGGPFANPNLGLLSGIDAQLARQQQFGIRTVASPVSNPMDNYIYTVNNTSNFTINEGLAIRNILSYQHQNTYSFQDATSLLYNMLPLTIFDHASQMSDEFQVLGNSFDKKLDWIVGLVYIHQHDHSTTDSVFFPNYDADTAPFAPNAQASIADATVANQNTSAFAHGVIDLRDMAEGLKLTLGARYSHDLKQIDETGTLAVPGQPTLCNLPSTNSPSECLLTTSHSESHPSWVVGLDYQATSTTMLYLASRHGYKSFGYNSLTGIPGTLSYEAETVTDVELGIKSDFQLGSMASRTNLAVFHGSFKNSDVPVAVFESGAPAGLIIENVPGSTIQGLEFEVSLIPVRGLELHGSYSLVDGKYKPGSAIVNSFNPDGSAAAPPIDLSGKPVEGSSRNTYQFSAEYRPQVETKLGAPSLGIDFAYRGAQFLPSGTTEILKLPAFGVLNPRISLDRIGGSKLNLTLWAKNALQRNYPTFMSKYAALGLNDTVDYGAPRTFGATFNYTF